MFAKETHKKPPKSEPGLFFGVIISHATFFSQIQQCSAAPSLSFHSLLKKRDCSPGWFCLDFFLRIYNGSTTYSLIVSTCLNADIPLLKTGYLTFFVLLKPTRTSNSH